MIDADRYNSTRTDPAQAVTANTTYNAVNAVLTSPSINLTGKSSTRIRFQQSLRWCCAGMNAFNLEMSVDNGNTWPHQYLLSPGLSGVNLFFQSEIAVNLSEELAQSADLSEVRFRFVFSDNMSHYYWMLDDIVVEAIPPNNLVAGRAWYTRSERQLDDLEQNEISTLEYYRNLRYRDMPVYNVTEFDLAMEVSNIGILTQHHVAPKAIITDPAGNEHLFTGTPVMVESNSMDTLHIGSIVAGLDFPIMEGLYSIILEAVQTQGNQDPGIYASAPMTFRLSNDGSSPGLNAAVFNKADPLIGFDVITNFENIVHTPYVFMTPEVGSIEIVGMDVVFTRYSNPSLPIEGIAYYNLRIGSLLDEVPADPSTVTTVVYEPDNPYFYLELEHNIQESDISLCCAAATLQWVHLPFPEAIPVDPGVVYGPELKLWSAANNVTVPISISDAPHNLFVFNMWFNEWEQYPALTPAIRLRTRLQCPDALVVEETACQEYQFHGETYTSSGSYAQTVTHSNGCTVDYTLNLTITDDPLPTLQLVEELCGTYNFYGTELTESGLYSRQFENAQGCDSLVLLDLTIKQHEATVRTEQACESFELHDLVYSQTGYYQIMYTNVQGCDSIVTLDLTINPAFENEAVMTSCFPKVINGVLYDATTTFTTMYSTVAGCDSLVAVEFTLLDLNDELCVCNSSNLNATTEAGVPTQDWCPADLVQLVNEIALDVAPGADMALWFVPTGLGPEALMAVDELPVLLNSSDDGFELFDLLSGSLVLLQGVYQVSAIIYSDLGSFPESVCSQTTVPFMIEIHNQGSVAGTPCALSASGQEEGGEWLIWPNPATTDEVQISFNPALSGNVQVIISDLLGRQLRSVSIQEGHAGSYGLSMAYLPSGTYLLTMLAGGHHAGTKRLVIQR